MAGGLGLCHAHGSWQPVDPCALRLCWCPTPGNIPRDVLTWGTKPFQALEVDHGKKAWLLASFLL